MSLLNFQIELARTNELLARIATALERLAGPHLDPPSPPELATLRDYSYIPPEELERAQAEAVEFAHRNMVVPGSDAHIKLVDRFEEDLRKEHGEDAVAALPWRVQTRI